MRLAKLSVLALAAAMAAAGFSGVRAQGYPNKPVRIIVPAQAGVGSDVLMRHLAGILSKSLGQQFFIENRPGAGGNIGMAAAAKAAPDGYTLVQGSLGQSVLNQFLFPTTEFDQEKDFEPVGMIVTLPYAIAANPDFPANTIPELVAASKAKPGTINVAISTLTAIVLEEIFKRSSGAQLFPVRYNGPAQATPNVLSGQVPIFIESVALLRPLITSGKLKPLGVTSLKSSDLLPGVKSLTEQGLLDFGDVTGWIGFYAPRGTPREAVRILNAETNKALDNPESRKRAFDLGALVATGTPEELGKFTAQERERWGKLIKAANIKAE